VSKRRGGWWQSSRRIHLDGCSACAAWVPER
jgi:hypothetical protein